MNFFENFSPFLLISFSEHRLDAPFARKPLECVVSESCSKTPSIDSRRKSSASSSILSVEPHESPCRNAVERELIRDRRQPQAHSGLKSGNDPRTELVLAS